jgi:hypothetical protein
MVGHAGLVRGPGRIDKKGSKSINKPSSVQECDVYSSQLLASSESLIEP